MYSVVFTDDKKFIFTKEQLMVMPYFNVLLISDAFLEKYIINISSSSIGFEYIHMYATMDEIDIIDPTEKYLFVIKQCDYFGYDKLKTLLEKKYGYKTDITNIKDKTGKETIIKMKYLGKINITKRIKPILFTHKDNRKRSYPNITIRCGADEINDKGFIKISETTGSYGEKYKTFGSKLSPEYLLYTFCKTKFKMEHYIPYVDTTIPHAYSNIYAQETSRMEYVDYDKTININETVLYNSKFASSLYIINPVYEYPEYSTDDEINEIYKKRYRKKYNTYFVKMIQNIISFNTDDIICVKINDSYKLISEVSEDEYENIDYIIVENEVIFKDKFLVKYIDTNLEIFEI